MKITRIFSHHSFFFFCRQICGSLICSGEIDTLLNCTTGVCHSNCNIYIAHSGVQSFHDARGQLPDCMPPRPSLPLPPFPHATARTLVGKGRGTHQRAPERGSSEQLLPGLSHLPSGGEGGLSQDHGGGARHTAQPIEWWQAVGMNGSRVRQASGRALPGHRSAGGVAAGPWPQGLG